VAVSGVRFAFYGRTSTADHQDPVSSRAWQVEIAKSVIAERGDVVVEFFDVGWSREVAWERRPRAAALLAAARNPRRPFDAVIVGEFERAFSARQFLRVADTLARHGIQVWLPEADGPVDPADPVHRALVALLGAKANHEVVRARHRTLAAMRAQTVEQGRFLGGRPPYGYRLVDAGPHPNRAEAAWGKRLHRLDPDAVTATHVRWMFARRLEGRSLAGIARELNDRGVLCPSQEDPERNRSRVGATWSVTTVKTILANPRYTGREVWNRRQSAGGTGRATVAGEAVLSNAVTHPALVTEKDFVAAQQVRAERTFGDRGRRRYLLPGLLRCGHCGRRMDAHWVHQRAGYRCRHGYRSTTSRPSDAPENIYLREDEILRRITARIVLGVEPQAGLGSTQEVISFLRSNNMVVEVYGPASWAVTNLA
jgi:DNA invertase Pin-like site-specific DNA recombinase